MPPQTAVCSNYRREKLWYLWEEEKNKQKIPVLKQGPGIAGWSGGNTARE